MRRAPLMLVAAWLLAACTVAPPAAAPPEPSPSAPPAVAPQPDVPDGGGTDDGVPDARACGHEAVAAMDTQVAGQLDAIAERDWDAALAFATRAFRSDHDDARFSQVISDGFPVVAANASHRSDGCVRDDDAAQLLVTVTATDGRTAELVYLLEFEGDAWRIGGAVPHGATDDDPDTQVV